MKFIKPKTIYHVKQKVVTKTSVNWSVVFIGSKEKDAVETFAELVEENPSEEYILVRKDEYILKGSDIKKYSAG